MIAILITAVAGTGAATGHLSEREPRRDNTSVLKDGASRSEKCPHAHRAVMFYSRRIAEHRAKMGAGRGTPYKAEAVKTGRAACPRYLAHVLQRKARAWRLRAEGWVETRTLRDFAFSPGNHAWHKAVREVQRVFPGTESWLLSCSAAEGGHGRWVGYSGVAYSTWLRDSDTVGGPLQFRFSTFTGMYRRAVDHVTGRGYRVPRMDSTTAWRSALGQAIAGGWARYTGNDNSHWSASWGNGC